MNPAKGGWLILLTLIGTMILAVAQLPGDVPDWLRWLRPDWAVAVFFFWTVAAPRRTGMVSAWIAGLLFDALLGHPLGLHGAGFAFTTFVASRFHERLSMYPLAQQAATVLAIAAIVDLANGLALAAIEDAELSPLLVLPALTTMLVYPVLAQILRRLADRYPVS